MKESWKRVMGEFIRMTRPANALIASIAVWTGWAVAEGDPFSMNVDIVLLAVSAAFVLSGGNILNDINDVDIDGSVHPERPLPRGILRPGPMLAAVIMLWFLGIIMTSLVCFRIGSVIPLIIIIISISLLLVYEEWAKERGLCGNITISFLTALPFIFGATLNERIPFLIIAFGSMAFFVNISREIIKDVNDIDADAGRRNTFPMRFGNRFAVNTGRILTATGIFLSILIMFFRDLNPIYLVLIILADGFFVMAFIDPLGELNRSSHMIKTGMAIAIMGFFSWSLV